MLQTLLGNILCVHLDDFLIIWHSGFQHVARFENINCQVQILQTELRIVTLLLIINQLFNLFLISLCTGKEANQVTQSYTICELSNVIY